MFARRPARSPVTRLRPLRQGRSVLALAGALVTLAAVFFLYYPPDLLRFFDYRFYDLLISERTPVELKSPPIIVGVDEASLAEFGQWPWPRYRLAQLINALQQQGVAAIGLDVLMPEADRTSPENIFRERQRDLGEGRPSGSLQQFGRTNDQRLAEAMAAAPVVLGYRLLFSGDDGALDGVSLPPLAQLVVRNRSGVGGRWPVPQGVLANLAQLASSARQGGFVNAEPDRDGVLRRLPLLLESQGNYYPSLALATLLLATGEQQLQLELLEGEAQLTWNGRQLPLDAQGNLLLGFATKPRYHYISATDLLMGRLAEKELAGRVVFVGAQAAGLGDRHVTPVGHSTPGLAVHAVVAASLLAGDWYAHPLWARGVELLFVILFGVASTLLLSRYGLLPPVVLLVCGSVGVAWGSVALFGGANLFIAPTMPILLLLVNTACLSLLKYGIEASNLRHRTSDLLKAQDATIVSLTTLADTRDSDTWAHILRTQRYVQALARQLQRQAGYREELTDEDVEMLFKSAPLHDIGKVGIPDRILLKQGKLSADEMQLMKDHTRLGAMALTRTAEVLGHPDSFAYLHYARQMAASHHERWDGSGYPYALQGDAIPLAGRLMALADVYDALISRRSYKEPFTHTQAKEMIVAESGMHFDPEVVAAFLQCEERFREISAVYDDELLAHQLA